MILSAFTEKYMDIQRKLTNSAIAEYCDNFQPVKIQWDTGATNTCISEELAKAMDMIPVGMIKIQTPSGSCNVNQYIMNLVLNNEVKVQNILVSDSKIGNQGIDVLVGMDVISLGDFSISNFEGRTQFSFRIPSQEYIEFLR